MRDLAISVDDVLAARARILPFIHLTPLIRCEAICRLVGREVSLKGEHLQRSGSFKLRGALNRLLQLDPQERSAGVVAFSSGNHAQGVALAGKLLGIKTTIVMPSDAPRVKLDATRAYGAEIVLYDRQTESREALAAAIAQKSGAVLVPPFDDPRVIAGQGTIGLEVLEQLPELEIMVVPVGGGGLISGIACAIKSLKPQVRVIGVEPEVADDARQSLAEGRIVRIAQPQTIADGVATQAVGKHVFPLLQSYVDEVVTVSEAEIYDAMLVIMTRAKQVVEPTGALTTAALLQKRIGGSGPVVSLLCGGNLDPSVLSRAPTIVG